MVDFEREARWWDAKAPREDSDRADEAVNRALRWRELERRLDGVRSILDVGGGTGAFSIPLARRGFEVTHLDHSPAMLEIARAKAAGFSAPTLVLGNAVDLSQFADRSFDLVLNMDGAISFCGPLAERALAESCRVAGRRLMVSVSALGWLIPTMLRGSLRVAGRILPAVDAMASRRSWRLEEYPENRLLAAGATLDYFGPLRAFTREELAAILESHGFRVLRAGGLGSLACLSGPEAVAGVGSSGELFEAFLDLCESFDRDVMPDGPGTRERAGLLAVAERRWEPPR